MPGKDLRVRKSYFVKNYINKSILLKNIMAKQRASHRSLREELRAKPDVVKSLVADVQRAVESHKIILEGLVDGMIWIGDVPTKDGGQVAMKVAMEGLKKDSRRYKQLNEDLQYWMVNYSTIQRYLFSGEMLPIGPLI